MFHTQNEKIQRLADTYPKQISELEQIFDRPTHVYIDYANVYYWQEKLGWHIDFGRLKQFFGCFDTIRSVRFYYGTLQNNPHSIQFIESIRRHGYDVATKDVKIMRLAIDVSGIPSNSPAVLKNFISKPLLRKLNLEAVEFLNKQLRDLNNQGIRYLEARKCNFDVEIGRDMLIDYEKNGVENFVLWSGDSDFADPVQQLLDDGKSVTIFIIARRLSVELDKTAAKIYDIRKIREFICWPREFQQRKR